MLIRKICATLALTLGGALALAAPPPATSTIELTVNGLVCGFCAQGIEKTLRKNAAARDVLVNLEHRTVAVALEPGADIADAELQRALQDAGYTVVAIARTATPLDEIRQRFRRKK